MKTQNLESITTRALSIALDAAVLRHQAIASNIANANTVGYIPSDIDFSSFVENAQTELNVSGRISELSLQNAHPRAFLLTDQAGQPAKVQLDQEMAKISENTMNYQALIKALNKHMSILAMASSEGKK